MSFGFIKGCYCLFLWAHPYSPQTLFSPLIMAAYQGEEWDTFMSGLHHDIKQRHQLNLKYPSYFLI